MRPSRRCWRSVAVAPQELRDFGDELEAEGLVAEDEFFDDAVIASCPRGAA